MHPAGNGKRLVVLVDTREQTPLSFPSDAVEARPATLTAGDYSMPGLTELCGIERKSLADLLACIGPERDRFKRELLRLRSYRCKAVVVEASFADIHAGAYRSAIAPAAVIGSLMSWQTRYGVPFVLAGDHAGAAVVVLALLRTYRQQVAEMVETLDMEGA